jgi:PAS domain S-box-containing protein
LTDRLFAVLAIVLWAATLLLYAITFHPSKVAVSEGIAVVFGLLAAGIAFVGVPLACSIRYPGHRLNPYLASISLAVCTVLFTRVSGRADSELAAFVVLAFLAFYRNVRVLVIATVIIVGNIIVTTADTHNLIGSVIASLVSERSEDVLWMLILDLVLYASIARISVGMRRGSEQQATLEALQVESIQSIAQRDLQIQETESVKTIIFESAPDAVIRCDEKLNIIEINSVAERMLGTTRQDAAGRKITDFVLSYAENVRPMRKSDRHALLFESNVDRTDGTQFVAEVSVAEVHGLSTRQFAIFVRDITERKALETKVAQSQKLQSIGQLAAGIAHEINTPTQYVGDNVLFLQDAFNDLHTLLGTYDTLEEAAAEIPHLTEMLQAIADAKDRADLEFLQKEIPKAIRESLDGIERISVIVRALKDFSHPGVDGMTASDVNRILESTATVARNEWKYVADLELNLCPSLPPVLCLPGELGQVTLNLIVNASHAIADKMANTGEKGLIRVTTSHDEHFITVSISDNGGGIPAAVKERVFDPFFTTKEVGKGTGQGLAIAHNVIVERHKGQLWFESEEGQGTTFAFKIPLDLSPSEEEEMAA